MNAVVSRCAWFAKEWKRVPIPNPYWIYALKIESDSLNFGCIDIGTAIAVCPDGRITACCGHIFSSDALKMFELGNIKKDGLIHAIKRMQRNVLYWWIALRGPVSILKTLKIEEEVYHKCEACDLLYKYNEKLRSIALKKEIIMEKLRKGEEIELHDCI
jgi:hypothetical protein